MGFPKGVSIPFGQGRGQYPGREVASFIVGAAPPDLIVVIMSAQ